MNKEIISKIKEIAYENVNKKIEEDLLKQEPKIKRLLEQYQELKNQQKEFIEYLENEKDRLIHGTSHYYIDSFDRQHAVNETLYDEVNEILSKYKEIIGDDK